MSRTTIQPDNSAQFKDKPIKADKWRNLTFDKAGESYLGVLIHKTETDALVKYIYM